MGGVSQIDFYKNKKLQLLFNTENKLYIIDRLGRFVKDFPISLPVKATNPHALFDYNKNRDYRILIAGEDEIVYNLKKDGNKVKGWKYKGKNGLIKSKLSHFTVQGKDYILCPSKEKEIVLCLTFLLEEGETGWVARRARARRVFYKIIFCPDNIFCEGRTNRYQSWRRGKV